MEPDALRAGPAVSDIQAAAAGGVLTADLGNGEDVPAVDQLAHLCLPRGGLGVELGGVDRHRLPGGDACGIDGDLPSGGGGHAQGLQLAAALTVLLAVLSAAAGINAVHDHAGAVSAVQKLLGQDQLVGHGVQIHVVVPLVAVQPAAQLIDPRLCHAGGQSSVQLVGEQLPDLIGQTVVLIVLQEHQLREADTDISRLLSGHADLYHVLLGCKGHDSELGHGGISPDTGPGLDVPAVGIAVIVCAGGHMAARPVQVVPLIPDQDAVGPQVGGMIPVQPGHPDSGLEVLGLPEGDHYMLIVPPVPCRPVGTVVPVRHVGRRKGRTGSVGRAVVVVLIRQPDGGNIPPVQHAQRGDTGRPFIDHGLGCPGGNPGGAAAAHVVSGHDVQVVGHAVGQAREGGPCSGQGLPQGNV